MENAKNKYGDALNKFTEGSIIDKTHFESSAEICQNSIQTIEKSIRNINRKELSDKIEKVHHYNGEKKRTSRGVFGKQTTRTD